MIKTKKAQIAIEYIIFIAIFLLFFQAIIKPSIDFAENVITDVQSVAIAKENVSKLADNINSFASSMGTGKVTILFYLPQNARLDACEVNSITYTVEISNTKPTPGACNNTNNCTFIENLFIGGHNISCPSINNGFSGELIIEKKDTGDFNVSIK